MLTGMGSFLTDCCVFAILTKLCRFHPLVANMISRPAGGLFSFLCNKYWTFKNKGKTRAIVQFGRFGLIWFANLGLSELLLGLFHEVIKLGPIQSKVWTELILAGITFTYLKFWAFR